MTLSIGFARPIAMGCGLNQLTKNIGVGSTLLGFTQYGFSFISSAILSWMDSNFGLPLSILILVAMLLTLTAYLRLSLKKSITLQFMNGIIKNFSR